MSTTVPVAPGPGRTRAPERRTAAAARARPGRPPKKSLRVRFRRDWQLLVMCIPMVLLLGVFHYIPILGYSIAFQDYSPFAYG